MTHWFNRMRDNRLYEDETIERIGIQDVDHCSSCHEDYDSFGFDMDFEWEEGGVEIKGTLCCSAARQARVILGMDEL